MALSLIAAATPPAAGQTIEGWRLHETPHFLIYVIDGTAGARDLDKVAAELERIHRAIVEPLGLPPALLLYPLYPSVNRFRSDWWRFATQGHGDFIHAWGTVYTGDVSAVSPYVIARAVVDDALPRLTRMLRWGTIEALGDLAAGVDSHAHLAALLAASAKIPTLASITPPWEFGEALPLSYPTAVSFIRFLIERYGLARTWAFIDRVNYRYYDFDDLFVSEFQEPVTVVESLWRARVASAKVTTHVDLDVYRAASAFVYRTTLASSPGQYMLRPEGATVVNEGFTAVAALRRLDLVAVQRSIDRARQAGEQAARAEHLRDLGWQALIAVLVLTPIVLSIGVLLWPTLRGRWRSAGRHAGG